MNEQETDPKIRVIYDGAYATRLNWKLDRLAEFANQGDLRTYVNIVTGDTQDQPQVSVLGDVLAWRNILSAANPFSEPDGLAKPSEVLYSQTEEGIIDTDVIINHQVLLERVKQQQEGRVDPEAYTNLLNTEVRRGLLSILMTEKTDLLKYTGSIFGLRLAAVIAGPVLLHLQSEAIRFLQLESVGSAEFETLFGVLHTYTEVLKYTIGPAALAAITLRSLELDMTISENPSQYLTSIKDMNPIKYPADLIRGWCYLRGAGRNLVELEN